MFFKKTPQKISKQNEDFSQEKRLYEFRENIKRLSKNEKSVEFLAKQLSRLVEKNHFSTKK